MGGPVHDWHGAAMASQVTVLHGHSTSHSAGLTAVHDDGVRSVRAEVSTGSRCWGRVTRPLCRRDTTAPGATVVPVARHREPAPSTGQEQDHGTSTGYRGRVR